MADMNDRATTLAVAILAAFLMRLSLFATVDAIRPLAGSVLKCRPNWRKVCLGP
jgi:hypothetical protein